MRVKPALVALPSLAVLLYCLYASQIGQDGAPKPPLVKAAAPRPVSSDAWLSSPAAMRHSPDVGPELPLSQQVDRLLANKTPADAFEAYQLVQSCVELADTGDLMQYDLQAEPPFYLRGLTPAERAKHERLCLGMTQRLKSDRLAYLSLAAKANVPGADLAFLRAGPFGDPSALKTRLDDALVVEWKRQAVAQLEAQAAEGSAGSVMALMTEYSSRPEIWGKDPALLLRYGTAMHDIFQQLSGDNLGYTNPLSDGNLRAMGEGLSAEQFAAAQASGHEVAARVAARSKSATLP